MPHGQRRLAFGHFDKPHVVIQHSMRFVEVPHHNESTSAFDIRHSTFGEQASPTPVCNLSLLSCKCTPIKAYTYFMQGFHSSKKSDHGLHCAG